MRGLHVMHGVYRVAAGQLRCDWCYHGMATCSTSSTMVKPKLFETTVINTTACVHPHIIGLRVKLQV